MLRIRLRRTGKRHQPSYRVVIVEHTAPVQGSYLESVGHFNPRASQLTINQDRVVFWLDRGAQPSERIAKLLTTLGMSHKLISLPDYERKPKRTKKKAPKSAAAPAEKPTIKPATAEQAPDELPVAETTETRENVTEAVEPTDTKVETEGGSKTQSEEQAAAN